MVIAFGVRRKKPLPPIQGCCSHSSGCCGRDGVESTLSNWVNFGLKTNIPCTLGVSVLGAAPSLELRPVRIGGFDLFSLHILPALQLDPSYEYFCAPLSWFSLHLFHGFFGSLGWENPLRSLSPTMASPLPCFPLNHVPKCHIHIPWTFPGMETLPLPWTACSCPSS